MSEKHFIKFIIALFATASLGANATTFTYSGEVTDATGAFAALTPVGTPIGGDIEIDAGAVAAGMAAVGDILDIGMAVGGFCFTWGAGTCGGAAVPITSIDASSMTFNGAGQYTGGGLSLTAFSPTFQLSIPIVFSGDGTFSASALGLGTVDGVGTLSPSVVPVPAAIWFLGSALLGVIGLRRRA